MSKKILLASLVAMTVVFGCGKDQITWLDESGQGQGQGQDQGDVDKDDINSVVFDRTVYVTFSSGTATVTGPTDSLSIAIDGNGVTIVNNSKDKIRYELSGSTTNGFFKVYSRRKQAVVLNAVSLVNPNGAAINIQGPQDSLSKGKRTFVVLNGTSSLSDGTNYTGTLSGEDEKGVIFSEGELIFSGSGTLNVTAKGKSGIVSDEYLKILEGRIDINSTSSVKATNGDTLKPACMKGKEGFYLMGGTLNLNSSGTGAKGISGDSIAEFSGGTLTVNVTGSNFGSSGGGFPRPGQQQSNNSVSAKGIKFDGNIVFSGSNVSVSCSSHEAIESKGKITISGGVVYGTSSSDDAINSSSDFIVNGGLVGAYATGNDALDANGNMYIRGGVVYAVSTAGTPEVSLDANTEGGKKLYIEGGTLVVIGGLENGAQLSQSCYQASSVTASTWYSITVGNDTYAFKTPASSSTGGGGGPRPGSGSTSLVVSGSVQPTVKSGVTVNGGTSYFNNTFTVGGTVSGGSQVSLSNYSGGGGGFPF